MAAGSVLFVDLVLVSWNDLKYFKGTHGDNKKCYNRDRHGNKIPFGAHERPYHNNCYADRPKDH